MANEETKKASVVESEVEKEITEDEIAKLNEKITKTLDEKKEAKAEKKYSQADLDEIVNQLSQKFSATKDTDSEDVIDLLAPNFNQRRFVSVPRFDNKFVVGLEDMNNDEYSDKPVYIMNVENPTIKTTGTLDHIPMAKFMFEDKSESKLYPYLQFLDKSQWYWCEILERHETDTSEVFGTVEVTELTENEWNMKGTGKKILSKAKRVHTVFTVRDIKDGKVFDVDEIIINKRIAPVDDLKRFLDKK